MTENKITVFVTASSVEEARDIARGVLSRRLAACANIISGIESHYWWEGTLQQDNEVLIIIKTVSGLFGELEKAIVSIHSYDVPEIIALPVTAGLAEYLDWISGETDSH